MNLELLEGFHQNFPESADGHLERIKKDENSREAGCATYAITLQFNRVGSLIAIGCNDGRIEIWDFITRRIAKILVAHSHPICSLSWSRSCRQLCSASTDNTVSIWNIVTNDCEASFTFPCPVMKVQFNPRNSKKILVCPLRCPPVLIDVESGTPSILSDPEGDLNIVASFDRRGKHIYCGNSKGKVIIQDSKTLKEVASFRSNTSLSNASIKSIEFSRRGDFFLLSCADKIIRVFNCKDVMEAQDSEVQPIQKLKDLVTGSLWRKCCFSGDGEYVCAGSMKQHSIYLWERASGTLMKILHGQKGETLLDVVWHPLRPIIVSLSNTANKEQVSIWAQPQQNWSAFAPDFKELDENVEYEERESEFDLEDEDKKEEDNNEKEDEDINVDIETIDPVPALLSSDEETEPEDVLMYLSITPEVENPEDISGFDDSLLQSAEASAINRKRTSLTSVTQSGVSPRANCSSSVKQGTPPLKKSRTISEASTDDNDGELIVKQNNFLIDIPNAPTDEIHPLLGNKRQQTKISNNTVASVPAGVINLAEGPEELDTENSATKKSFTRQNSSRSTKIKK